MTALLRQHEWGPVRVVEEIRRRTPQASLASELATIELICLAGSWLSQPGAADLLAEVDELVAATPDNGEVVGADGSNFEMVIGGFHVGTTIPGWLGRTEHEMSMLRLAVLETLAVSTAVSEGSYGFRPSTP